MISRGRPITKADVQNLLKDYDANKGYLRSLWGDTDGIDELRSAYTTHLAMKSDEVLLNDTEIDTLISVLRTRLGRIHNNVRNYRAAPDKLTNSTYIKLANLISDYKKDKKVLLLVQHYKNDFAKEGKFIFDIEGEIFITESGYVASLHELLDEIQSTKGYLHTIHDSDGVSKKIFALLSPGDIDALRNIPCAQQIISDLDHSAERQPASARATW